MGPWRCIIGQFVIHIFAGMQNLSISCSLVCLIILGSAVLVGSFGLCRHQISAVLVTGVMYLLAGKHKIRISWSWSNSKTSVCACEQLRVTKFCYTEVSVWVKMSRLFVQTGWWFRFIRILWFSATFALFTLTIIYFKRAQDRGARIIDGPEDGVIGGPAPKSVLNARRFTTAWSMDFGWGGVTLCALASVAWILLSKIMRFSPISSMIA